MSKLYHVHLTDDQRAHLEHLLASGTHPAHLLAPARVLLLADQGYRDQDIADVLHLGRTTVERIRKAFATRSFEAALHPRRPPGRPVHFTGDVEAQLVLLVCSDPPPGRARWTLQLLADKLVELQVVDSISDQQVYNMLKKTSLSLGARSSGASPRRTPAL